MKKKRLSHWSENRRPQNLWEKEGHSTLCKRTVETCVYINIIITIIININLAALGWVVITFGAP